MDETRIKKRLIGIARYWQKQFRLPYDELDDVIQGAWILWYERPTVEIERRFKQVHNGVRRQIIKQIFGRIPHQEDLRNIDRPVFVDSSYINDSVEPDFINRVHLREIMDAASRKVGHNCKRVRTLRMMLGVEDRKKISKKAYNEGVRHMRKLLRDQGLAA